MRDPIAEYTSNIDPAEFAGIDAFVRSLVADYGPATDSEARLLMSVTTRHVHHCLQVGLPLDREVILRRDVIAISVSEGMDGAATRTKASVRSHLFRLSDALLTGPHRHVRVTPMERGTALAPYSAREVSLLRAWAENQATDYRRAGAKMLLCLGLGAGLSAREIGGVRNCDVTMDSGGVLVEVTAGPHPRTVPVLAAWEAPFSDLATDDPQRFVFQPLRRNAYVRSLLSNFVLATRSRPFSIRGSRLRATWIVHHLTIGTPVQVLTKAAGLESPEALGPYIAYAPPVEPERARRALRGEAH